MFSWKYTGREVAAPGYIKEKAVSLHNINKAQREMMRSLKGGV